MTTATDPIPAREQAFAEWLRAALLAVIPADGTTITHNDARLTVTARDDAPRGLTMGDVLRAMMRMGDAGEIEWCGVEGPTSVRRRSPAPTIDASRLRAIAAVGADKLARDAARIREELREEVTEAGPTIASYLVATAQRLAAAEAREEGYRAAVADLLGAVL